jgi:hypothetical protein
MTIGLGVGFILEEVGTGVKVGLRTLSSISNDMTLTNTKQAIRSITANIKNIFAFLTIILIPTTFPDLFKWYYTNHKKE